MTILVGDCRDRLREMPDNSVDAVVTDPPYELGFMGKKWDASGIAYDVEMWREVLRVLKPGGYLLSFGGTRTYHRMACAIEDAGFTIRDCLQWLYGSGFPKSLNVCKAGAAEQWEGYGTALKPACEPIVLAQKPLEGTYAANLAKWGVGALNIDGCRVGTEARVNRGMSSLGVMHDDDWQPGEVSSKVYGRWPANVLLDDAAASELDAQTGKLTSGKVAADGFLGTVATSPALGDKRAMIRPESVYGDSGGASRFFYVAKASRKERDQGCEHLPAKTGGEATDREEGTAGLDNPRAGAGRTGGAKNYHPTVKPIQLMRYLCRLVTPPGGTVLDPFTGSGTTGVAALSEGFRFTGIELSDEYATIANARIASVAQPVLF